MLGEGPADFFIDACKLMEKPSSLRSTTHIVGHLLREIDSSIRNLVDPFSKEKKNNIESVIEILELDPNISSLWLDIHKERKGRKKLHAWAHRKGLDSPRNPDREFSALWEDMLVILQHVLHRFEAQYLKYVKIIDSSLAQEKVSKNDHEKLSKSIPRTYALTNYLFKNIPSPDWIPLLSSNKFFKNPYRLHYTEDNHPIYQPWPQSEYLQRMAPHAPKDVLDIALSTETNNPYIIHNFTMAACDMPGDLAAKWTEKLISWIKADNYMGHLLEIDIKKLICHLAQESKSQEALALIETVLRILPPNEEETRSFDCHLLMDHHHTQIVLNSCIPVLLRSDHSSTFEFLFELLKKAIESSDFSAKTSPTEHDFSTHWRPAVENHEQNEHIHKDLGLLADALRDSAQWIFDNHPNEKRAIIERLDSTHYPYFKRLTLHLLRYSPNNLTDHIEAKVGDRNNFSNSYIRHEYMRLVNKALDQCSKRIQTKFFQWLDEDRPDKDLRRKNYLEHQGKEPTEEQVQIGQELWQRDMLSLIPDQLPPQSKEHYEELVRKHGQAEYPDFTGHIITRWGSKSPVASEEIKDKPIQEIIDLLINFKEPPQDFFGPNWDGLGSQLKSIARERALEFCKNLRLFCSEDIAPAYSKYLLRGLEEAYRESPNTVSWEPLLTYGIWVVSHQDPVNHAEVNVGNCWSEARRNVVSLIKKGLKEKGDGKIPYEFREVVWNILSNLCEDPDPDEGQTLMSDYLTTSINVMRGIALEGVIQYLFWVRDHQHEEEFSIRSSASEAGELLLNHLDPDIDPSPYVRPPYGLYFTHLYAMDKSWVNEHFDMIFNPENLTLKTAAWEGYLLYSQNLIFDNTKELYKWSLDRIQDQDETSDSVQTWGARLAQHLMIYYIRGHANLDDPNDLVPMFFQKTNDQIRSEAIDFLGRQAEGINNDELLQRLWEWRLHAFEDDTIPSPQSQELSAFTWWMHSGRFPDKWALENYLTSLERGGIADDSGFALERIVKCAEDYPELAFRSVALACEQLKEEWFISFKTDEIKSVLKTALRSGIPDLESRAQNFVQKLGTWGHFQFKDLAT